MKLAKIVMERGHYLSYFNLRGKLQLFIGKSGYYKEATPTQLAVDAQNWCKLGTEGL